MNVKTGDKSSRAKKKVVGKTPEAARVAQDTARYEALAREHGADLSEEGFNEALRKVARHKGANPNDS